MSGRIASFRIIDGSKASYLAGIDGSLRNLARCIPGTTEGRSLKFEPVIANLGDIFPKEIEALEILR